MSTSTHRSESVFNKYEFEYTVKTSFTPEITLRKSRVESRWDLASLYVVQPCLLTGPVFWGWLELEVKTCHKM